MHVNDIANVLITVYMDVIEGLNQLCDWVSLFLFCRAMRLNQNRRILFIFSGNRSNIADIHFKCNINWGKVL